MKVTRTSVSTVPLNIEQCFLLFEESLKTVEEYKIAHSSPDKHYLVWSKAVKNNMGIDNPRTMRADIISIDTEQTQITFTHELPALVDPFGLGKKAIELFEKTLKEKLSTTRIPKKNASFCSECGKLIAADAKFCAGCGVAINIIKSVVSG